MGKNNYITIAESPNSLGHPTPFPQFYLPSSPQSHAHRRGLGRLCSGRKGQGRDRALPVRSEGTRYFLLSRSGTLALGAFSTITWEDRQRVGMKTAESNQCYLLSTPYKCPYLKWVSLGAIQLFHLLFSLTLYKMYGETNFLNKVIILLLKQQEDREGILWKVKRTLILITSYL